MEIWPQMPVGVLNRSLGRAEDRHTSVPGTRHTQYPLAARSGKGGVPENAELSALRDCPLQHYGMGPRLHLPGTRNMGETRSRADHSLQPDECGSGGSGDS